MYPNPNKIAIAVVGEAMGSFKLVVIIQRSLSYEEAERIRRSGQIDCGRRQFLSPLQLPQLPDEVVNALFEAELASADNDMLEYGGADFGTGTPKADAERAAEIICRIDPRFQIQPIDRTIPCL